MSNFLQPIENFVNRYLAENKGMALFPNIKGVSPTDILDKKRKEEVQRDYIDQIKNTLQNIVLNNLQNFGLRQPKDALLSASENMYKNKVNPTYAQATFELVDLEETLKRTNSFDMKDVTIKAQENMLENYFKGNLRDAILSNDQKIVDKLSATFIILNEEHPRLASHLRSVFSRISNNQSIPGKMQGFALEIVDSPNNIKSEVFEQIKSIDPMFAQKLENRGLFKTSNPYTKDGSFNWDFADDPNFAKKGIKPF